MIGCAPNAEMNVSTLRRFLPVAILLLGLVCFLLSGVQRHISFETISRNHAELTTWVAANRAPAAILFVIGYAVAVSFSLPAGALLTALSGFLFGVWLGPVLSITAGTIGAVTVFLAARSAFYDLFHARAGPALSRLEEGFRRDSFSYLVFLRLVPIFPFWLVNIVSALLGMRLDRFVLGTIIGAIPGAAIFASLGASFGMLIDRGEVPDLGVIFQPRILLPLLGLAVLALVPVIYARFRSRKAR
jgi:uncharacterized membrane protein YdjX (TVP38/TMEM64 family)